MSNSQPRRHPVGVAGQFIGNSGIDQLRFSACEDLLDAGAVMVDETGRTSLSGSSLLLTMLGTRATHTFEAIIALCSIGRGAQAAMLNRSLLEDALDVSWVFENQSAAPALADEHERLVELGERAQMLRFGRDVEALDQDEQTELKTLLKRYDNFRASWTQASAGERLKALKRTWDAEAESYLDQTYELIQRQNNTLLHSGPTSLTVVMLPDCRGPNRIGPDLWWRQALAHGILGYYLICRIIARQFDFDVQPAMDAYLRGSCFTKELTITERAGMVPWDTCVCGSGLPADGCHLS